MKPLVFLFLVTTLLTSCTSVNKSTYLKEGTLIWQDDFNGEVLNDAYWSKIPRGKVDWNDRMSSDARLYVLENGNLILRGMVNDLPQDTVPHLTGGVYTKEKKAFQNGRIEIRAKLNGAKGAWPAFWMLPEINHWPNGGEIDIMERLNYDDYVYQTIHTHYTHELRIKEPKNSSTMKINPHDYNVYSVELLKDEIKLYVNGKLNLTYPRIETEIEGQFPFNDQKFYLLIDMQLGGEWVGDVDNATLPVQMEIDWVKFYSYSSADK